jgi:RHS repeat-associated protein
VRAAVDSERVGDFRVLRYLGEGAAGEVFLGTPVVEKSYAAPGELVAVKRYKATILDRPNQLKRIEREARVGTTLAHEHLVRIFHRYVGAWDKQYDTTNGLILMGARPYDPTLGRFLAVDPIDGGSLNNYDYAGQDPINKYDLDGTCVLPVWFHVCGDPPGLARTVRAANRVFIATAGITFPLAVGGVATVVCGPCGVVATVAVASIAGGVTKGVVSKYVQGHPTKQAVEEGVLGAVGGVGNRVAFEIGKKVIASAAASIIVQTGAQSYAVWVMTATRVFSTKIE